MDYNEVLASLMTIEVTFGGNRKRREVESMTRCVNISIIPDSLVENDETFTVTLSTEDPDVVLNPQNATVIIRNNECKFPFPCTIHLISPTNSFFDKTHYFNNFSFIHCNQLSSLIGLFVRLN